MLRSHLTHALRRPRSVRLASTSASSRSGLGHAALGLGAGVLLSSAFFLLRPAHADAQPPQTPKARVGTSAVPVRDPPARQVSVDADSLARELREALGDADGRLDRVSTDPEVLHVHGYSENDYHPGTSSLFLLIPPSPC